MPFINKIKRSNKRAFTDKRKERQEIYNTSTWIKMRESKMIESPLCELCLKEGKIKEAEHIHHKISFMTAKDILSRKAIAFDYSNLQSLCSGCHNQIHNHTNNFN